MTGARAERPELRKEATAGAGAVAANAAAGVACAGQCSREVWPDGIKHVLHAKGTFEVRLCWKGRKALLAREVV